MNDEEMNARMLVSDMLSTAFRLGVNSKQIHEAIKWACTDITKQKSNQIADYAIICQMRRFNGTI